MIFKMQCIFRKSCGKYVIVSFILKNEDIKNTTLLAWAFALFAM